MAPPEYSELPPRVQNVSVTGAMPTKEQIDQKIAQDFSNVGVRPGDKDGDTETLDNIIFTHHFVRAPGDYEDIEWHYVTCGKGAPIVFLHGIPDTWFQWHHQMSALSDRYLCVGVDLKGYGQSEKGEGDYRHEGVSEQLYTMLQQIGLKQFYLVTHDRGTVQADFITANHPEAVLGYARGEQHLYHFHPSLAPQGPIFRDAPYSGVMEDPKHFVLFVYAWITTIPIPNDEMARVVQEFSYPGITHAVPRYFNSSTFRQEWLTRRNRLLGAWKCPVMIMQGYESKTQPREFYEKAREYIPNAKDVKVSYIDGGHFWTLESPKQTTEAIEGMLAMAEGGAKM